MPGHLLIRPGEPGEPALWIIGGRGAAQPTDADELGVSDGLGERIEAWLDGFDALFDPDAPEARAFESEAERRAFVAEGRAIAAACLDELGPGWRVEIDLAPWDGDVS
jgi:hypothetical protein